MELSRIKAIITEQFRQQKGVIAVLLYGSQAKGMSRLDSDVDIAVLYAEKHVPDPLELWEFHSKLYEIFECNVDLVCLNQVGPIISTQIYKYHVPLLVNDQRKLDTYFMYLISDYAELKELRKPMEDHILERRYYDRS